MYAAAAKVVGWKVTVTAGDASVYAGTPSGSHGPLASLSAGQSFTVPTLSAGVVVSLQGGREFQYTLTPSTPPTQEPTGANRTDGTDQYTDATRRLRRLGSRPGRRCWRRGIARVRRVRGVDQTAGQAAVWPAAAEPSRARHGYTVSHDVYASAAKVVGWKITVTAGDASVYAGTPTGSHSSLASLSAGQSFTVPTLQRGCGRQPAERRGVPVHAHPEHAAHPGTHQYANQRHPPVSRHRTDGHADRAAGRFVGAGDVELHGYPVPVGRSVEQSGGGLAGCGRAQPGPAWVHRFP